MAAEKHYCSSVSARALCSWIHVRGALVYSQVLRGFSHITHAEMAGGMEYKSPLCMYLTTIGSGPHERRSRRAAEKNIMRGASDADRNLGLLHSSCSCHLVSVVTP